MQTGLAIKPSPEMPAAFVAAEHASDGFFPTDAAVAAAAATGIPGSDLAATPAT